MSRLAAAFISAWAALAWSPASAGPLQRDVLDPEEMGWFYNRVGATPEELSADMQLCAWFAQGMTTSTSPTRSQGGLVTGVFGALMYDYLTGGPARAHADDCMMSRGYRRFNTSEPMASLRARIEQGTAEDREAFAGAETPPLGQLAREWSNTYWMGAGVSFRAPDRRVSPEFGVAESPHRIHALRPNDAITPGANDAVFVINLRREDTGDADAFITFARVEPDSGRPAPALIQGARRERWPGFRARLEGDTESFVFVAPAGTYALAEAFGRNGTTQFCYGTLAIAAAPGDVIHLGDVALRPSESAPMSLSPPAGLGLRIDTPDLNADRALLARAPQLAARLRFADYAGGFRYVCHPMLNGVAVPVYGLDNPNLPWAVQSSHAK